MKRAKSHTGWMTLIFILLLLVALFFAATSAGQAQQLRMDQENGNAQMPMMGQGQIYKMDPGRMRGLHEHMHDYMDRMYGQGGDTPQMGPQMGMHGMRGHHERMQGAHHGTLGMQRGRGHGKGHARVPRGKGGPIPVPREVTLDDVTQHLERQLARLGNDRLKLGKITDKDGDTILAEIVTQDDSLVQRIEVDRRSGKMLQVQ